MLIAKMRLRHDAQFDSDMNAKSVSLPLACGGHTLLVVLLCRHFAESSFFICLWLVTQQLRLVAETACRGLKLRPCSGILPRDSTCLRLVQQGSQLTCACSVQATRDFLLIGSAARDRPFSLHTSLLRRKLSLFVRTLERLCSASSRTR